VLEAGKGGLWSVTIDFTKFNLPTYTDAAEQDLAITHVAPQAGQYGAFVDSKRESGFLDLGDLIFDI